MSISRLSFKGIKDVNSHIEQNKLNQKCDEKILQEYAGALGTFFRTTGNFNELQPNDIAAVFKAFFVNIVILEENVDIQGKLNLMLKRLKDQFNKDDQQEYNKYEKIFLVFRYYAKYDDFLYLLYNNQNCKDKIPDMLLSEAKDIKKFKEITLNVCLITDKEMFFDETVPSESQLAAAKAFREIAESKLKGGRPKAHDPQTIRHNKTQSSSNTVYNFDITQGSPHGKALKERIRSNSSNEVTLFKRGFLKNIFPESFVKKFGGDLGIEENKKQEEVAQEANIPQVPITPRPSRKSSLRKLPSGKVSQGSAQGSGNNSPTIG